MSRATLQTRWIFVDLLRFSAVLLMIQGHTFNAVLNTAYRDADWFPVHSFWHGFTAPMFLFASGLAFGIATFRKWHRHVAYGDAVQRRLRRYGLLLVLGYGLHLPFFSLSKILTTYETSIISITKVDALHVIGVSLLVCQGLVYVFKDRKSVATTLGLLGLGLVLTAPLVWHIPFAEYMPYVFAAYLNSQTGSLFPFIAWSAYLFGGLVTAYLLKPWEADMPKQRDLFRVGLISIGLVVAARAFSVMDGSVYPTITWNSNPAVFMMRLGTIMAFLMVLYQFEQFIRYRAQQQNRPVQGGGLQAISLMATETLSIYVVHLLILYGSILNQGFIKIIGRTLSVTQAIIVFSLLTLLMYGFARGWHYLKKQWPQPLLLGQMTAAILFILFFVNSPY